MKVSTNFGHDGKRGLEGDAEAFVGDATFDPSRREFGARAAALALTTTIPAAAHAQGDAAQQARAALVARLGVDLTPNGAEMAGNREGTIPAWAGGLTRPPTGWQPSMGYTDPFRGDRPILRIDARNLEQHRDKVTPGLQAMFRRYPATFFLDIYPTRRSFALPQAIYDATRRQAATARLNGLGIEGYVGPGTPFPVPRTGVEAMYNHTTRFFGSVRTCRDWLPVRANGDFYRVGLCEDIVQGQNMVPRQDGILFSMFAHYDAPATLQGTIYLIHDSVDFTRGGRSAWIYNAGQRRVRRAPDLAYDNIDDGTEGMRTTDDYWGFQGSKARYDFNLVGKREMYIPYNAYRLQDPSLKYADMLERGHIKSDLQRYELHRVWVVDATLKPGMSHVLPRRTFYIDEDSHTIALADGYDSRGNMWRVYTYPLVQAYDAGVMFQAPFVTHDVSNGNFIVTGLTNERRQPAYTWGHMGRWADFQVDAIRRRGTR